MYIDIFCIIFLSLITCMSYNTCIKIVIVLKSLLSSTNPDNHHSKVSRTALDFNCEDSVDKKPEHQFHFFSEMHAFEEVIVYIFMYYICCFYLFVYTLVIFMFILCIYAYICIYIHRCTASLPNTTCCVYIYICIYNGSSYIMNI